MSSNDFDFDYEGEDFNRPEGGAMISEGSYCFQVTEIVQNVGDNGFLIKLEVISGEPPTETGKVHFEYFNYPTGKPDWSNNKDPNVVCLRKFQQLFFALKLTTKEELEAMAARHERFRPDWDLALGRLCCGKLKKDEWEGKVRMKLLGKTWDLWSVDSPKSAGIPIPSSGNGNGNGQSSATSSTSTASTQPAAGVNDPELDAMLG